MNSEKLPERIKTLRTALGLSYQDLADRTGLSKSTLQRYETGTIRNIKVEKLDILAGGLGTTTVSLLGLDGTENTGREKNSYELISSNIYRIPVFDSVSAGFGCYADSCSVGCLPTYVENPTDVNQLLWINVRGDSMAPTIDDGDRILVRRQDSVENGSVAVVMIGDEAFVKKIKYGKNWIELHSINPYYPVRRFEKEEADSIRIVGIVKEVCKRL